jgi:sodium-independent sulfate anion transporter 11
LEFVIWWAAVLVTVFSSIENGIYTSIIASIALLVLRIMVPRGQFLGKVALKEDQDNKSRVIRQVFLPLDSQTDDRSQIKVTAPAPGVIIYRHEDGLLYPNSSEFNIILVDYVKQHTRRGKDMALVPLSERPWNDPGPKRGAVVDESSQNLDKPIIRAIVLDFSTV